MSRGDSALIAVARGDAPPDLVIEGAHVLSVFTREWLEVDVAIAGGRIAGLGDYDGGERVDARGQYLVPGLHRRARAHRVVEAHARRVRARVVPHGTTAVVTDPHEVANVLGREGVEWMLEASEGLPLDVFVMAPSCVPASDFESPMGPLEPADMEAILRHPRALGVAEMMNFPGVIAGAPDVLARLRVAGATHADGHAPGVVGRALDAYVAAGIRSDHEATTFDEALEKRRRGMWVLMREASNARNLRDLLPLVGQYGPEHCAFCTDDREPDFLFRDGHIDQMCRVAVEEGCSPEAALLMATLHPARCHGLMDRGAIAPGMRADLVLLDDLETFAPARVYKDGGWWPSAGRAEPFDRPPIPERVRSTMRSAPLPADAFAIPAAERVRVIETIPGQLITHAREEAPPVSDGRVVADPARDLAKIAVIERHHATGRVGLGLVRGFGLRAGAFASTVAHDAHNLVVVGVTDEDMTACARRAAGDRRRHRRRPRRRRPRRAARCRSPACCPTSRSRTSSSGSSSSRTCCVDQGVQDGAPFMTLSFLALSVIPALKITDRGLVDVDRFELVPLSVE